jgi:hypothetical protein
MDFAARVFLESPALLGLLSFLAFATVLLARRRMERSGRTWSLPAALAGIALLFVVQALVETRREAVGRRVDALIAAVERNDLDALGRLLSPAHSSEGMDREAMLAFIGARLERLAIYDTRVGRREIRVDGDRAVVEMLATATVRVDGAAGERHTGRWRIGLARESGEWRIVSIAPLMVDFVLVGGWREVRGYLP